MRFLIVKTSALGDIIHAFSVLEYLKSKYSDAIIDWVVEEPFADLVKAHPLVNQTFCIRSKAWRKAIFKKTTWQEICAFKKLLQNNTYDTVFDLQGNTKSAFVTKLAKSPEKIGFAKETVSEFPNTWVTTQRFNPPFGVNVRKEYLSIVQQYAKDPVPFIPKGVLLQITDEQKKQVQTLLLDTSESTNALKVLVCPGAFWPNKQLTTETLLDFLQQLSHQYGAYFLLGWGSPSEQEIAKKLHEGLPHSSTILSKLSLPVLQNLMGQMDLVIAMDSLPLHLAGTTTTKTFSFFGPSSSLKYKPEGPSHFAIQGSCPYGKQFDRRCSVLRTCSTGACIKDLQVKELLKQFQSWWTSSLP